MIYHAGTLDHQIPSSAGRHRRTRELAIYLLTPGFSIAYHAHALGVSCTTIHKHLAWSRALAEADPTIFDDVRMNSASITPDDALRMAQRRGATHLPWWSRLAIAEYSTRLQSTGEVAAMFRCSRRTVQIVLTRGALSFNPFTGERQLSSTQASPPGKWTGRISPVRC
jgi:hypothetical protein